jgi:hypothetical protein
MPAVWAFHCHNLYHMAAGMFATAVYRGSRLTSVGFRRVEPKASVDIAAPLAGKQSDKPRRSPSIVVVGLARVKLKRFGS